MQIVTGRRGEPHVTSRQMQAVYRSFLGDFALLDVGAHLAATATSNDNVRISDGVVAVQGIYAVIAYNEYDDNYIEPVSVGMKRIDTLILHYTKSNDIEDMQIEVVEGEEVVDNPVAPTIAEGGDAWEGTADIKVPIYDVLVTSFGLTVTPYSRMNTLIPTLDSIAERIPESIVTGVKGDSEALYRNGNVNITKDNIGLGNVDNTADTDKPISTATQTALNLKADLVYVNAVVASAYHAGGNLTVAELTSSLLIADNMGKVYNMSDSGVTTADFVEGAGKPIREGDDIGICNRGTVDNPIYKFNLLSGFVDLSAYATTSAVNAGLAEKVDKVAGKGLSTEDYTDAEKQKLANIESNAQANVQSDWNEDDTEDDGYIKNKPDLSTSLTATGNPLTIESSESNLVECVAEVKAVQEGSGDPSPTNIRPITGQTEVVIDDVGKNLCPIEKLGSTGSQHFNLPSGSYSFSFNLLGTPKYSTSKIKLQDSNNNIIAQISAYYPQSRVTQFELSEITEVYINPENINMDSSGYCADNIQIELGSTASTYEPYKGKTYTIQLGDTIYGGELDVVKGELRVINLSKTLSSADFISAFNAADGRRIATVSTNAKAVTSNGEIGNVLCSVALTGTANNQYNGTFKTCVAISIAGHVLLTFENITTDADFQAKLDELNPQIVYELATPYTIQLTPQQIRLLKGTNHLSCNTGDLSIKYYPDNVLGQLKGDIEKGLNAYYDYQIKALWDKIEELQA